MTAKEFKQKVKVGSIISTKGDWFKCTDIPMDEFMYSFRNILKNRDCMEFSLIGITDGSVEDIELID